MKIMLVMNIVNVIGNAVLVLVFHMGVVGISIPTLLSRIGAALIVLFLAHKESCELRLVKVFSSKLELDMLKKILNIGAPFGFENGMFFLGRLIVLSVVAIFGTASIAANSVAGSIVMFQALPGMAINLRSLKKPLYINIKRFFSFNKMRILIKISDLIKDRFMTPVFRLVFVLSVV